jgi:FixJ family two-component response regulator
MLNKGTPVRMLQMRGWMTKNPLIAVVDDDESVRESLYGFLESMGYAVEAFSSAEAFLESGSLGVADCLLLDVRMPKMNGPALQRRLSASEHKTSIIFITSHDDDNVRSQALRNGAVAFLLKPFSDDALVNAIQTALK